MYLPNELLEIIYQYSNLKDLQTIKKVNRFSYSIAHKLQKKLFIETYFPEKIKVLLRNNDFDLIDSVELLPFTDHFMNACCDYIDGVFIEDLDKINPKANIFVGIDRIGRPFMSIKLTMECYLLNIKETFVNTLFKRYTNTDNERWCVGSCYDYRNLTHISLDASDLQLYKQVIYSTKTLQTIYFAENEDEDRDYIVSEQNPDKLYSIQCF